MRIIKKNEINKNADIVKEVKNVIIINLNI